MRSYQTRVIPNAIAGVIIRKDHLDRDRQRIPCEDRGKGAWLDAGLPWWLSGKESAYQCRRHEFSPDLEGSNVLRSMWDLPGSGIKPCLLH